jgi:hypothetical protein
MAGVRMIVAIRLMGGASGCPGDKPHCRQNHR